MVGSIDIEGLPNYSAKFAILRRYIECNDLKELILLSKVN